MLRFERAGRPYVLRRGPQHLRPISNKVILRETQVLAALAGTDVPHPRLIAVCDDPSVLGDAVFYLMEPIDGFNAGAGTAGAARQPTRSVQFEMGLSMADALARARRRRPCRGGPRRFRQAGRIPGTSSATLAFGAGGLLGVRQLPRSRHRRRRRRRELARRAPAHQLDAGHHARRLPRRQRDVLPHRTRGRRHRRLGDVHHRRSAAGPGLDAGHLALPGTGRRSWPGADGCRRSWPRQTIWSNRYAQNTTRDLSNINWYAVLACFKLGIILEGSNARAAAGLAPKEIGDHLHDATVRLFERAHALIEGDRSDRLRDTRRDSGAARRDPRIRRREDRAVRDATRG